MPLVARLYYAVRLPTPLFSQDPGTADYADASCVAQMPSLAAESPVEPVEQAVRETHKLPETPVQTHIEVPADVSCAPPAVSVTIKGAPDNAEEPKAARKTFTPEPARVRHSAVDSRLYGP